MSEQISSEVTSKLGSTAPNNGPRDVFLHLLAIIALYVGVFELLALLFGFVDVASLESSRDWSDPLDSIRFAVANLVVVFPVFIWLARFIVRDLAAQPGKINLWTCRCSVYLTIFLGVVTLIVDLIYLLYYLLENQIAAPFLLKAAAVMVVIVTVLFYYLAQIRQSPLDFPSTARKFAYPAAVAVGMCVVAGVIVSGPPMHQHFVHYDDARVVDLKIVQGRVLKYWHSQKALPDDLAMVESQDPVSRLPRDPGTGTIYEYNLINPHSFNLCAGFLTKSPTVVNPWQEGYVSGWGWEHDAGRSCYQRDVNSLLTTPSPSPRS